MLTQQLKQQISEHALQAYPHECCGLVINGVYHACKNVAFDTLNNFEIDTQDYINLTEQGQLQAIVHSHPDGEPLPSEVDKVQMCLHDVPWLIASVNNGKVTIRQHKPKPYVAPLLGREYHHGKQDCYSLVIDYYKRELNIDLPDFDRKDGWWENADSESLYISKQQQAGFYVVDDLQKHDLIICRVGRTQHANHALIYLGDGDLTSENTSKIIASNVVLHHPYARLSVREVYGREWQKRTAFILRHRGLK